MAPRPDHIRRLYRALLRVYPRAFRERFGESILQTFDDMCQERRRESARGMAGFLLWLFAETAGGALHERLRHTLEGAMTHTTARLLGASAALSLLTILPLILMELTSRGPLGEEFPLTLFLALWLNALAICLIVLPIGHGMLAARRSVERPGPPAQRLSPRASALISVALLLALGAIPLLGAAGWLPLERIFNGPSPEVAYLPGQLLALALIALPIGAGVVAARPIVHAVRAGGSLLEHPLHLLIVATIALLFALGLIGMVVDQWPCFTGVPNCD